MASHHEVRAATLSPAASLSRPTTAVLAMVFGMFLVFGVGFAQPNVLHNAAHDARHGFAFPCH